MVLISSYFRWRLVRHVFSLFVTNMIDSGKVHFMLVYTLDDLQARCTLQAAELGSRVPIRTTDVGVLGGRLPANLAAHQTAPDICLRNAKPQVLLLGKTCG